MADPASISAVPPRTPRDFDSVLATKFHASSFLLSLAMKNKKASEQQGRLGRSPGKGKAPKPFYFWIGDLKLSTHVYPVIYNLYKLPTELYGTHSSLISCSITCWDYLALLVFAPWFLKKHGAWIRDERKFRGPRINRIWIFWFIEKSAKR
jgi:hypothetical protein